MASLASLPQVPPPRRSFLKVSMTAVLRHMVGSLSSTLLADLSRAARHELHALKACHELHAIKACHELPAIKACHELHAIKARHELHAIEA